MGVVEDRTLDLIYYLHQKEVEAGVPLLEGYLEGEEVVRGREVVVHY